MLGDDSPRPAADVWMPSPRQYLGPGDGGSTTAQRDGERAPSTQPGSTGGGGRLPATPAPSGPPGAAAGKGDTGVLPPRAWGRAGAWQCPGRHGGSRGHREEPAAMPGCFPPAKHTDQPQAIPPHPSRTAAVRSGAGKAVSSIQPPECCGAARYPLLCPAQLPRAAFLPHPLNAPHSPKKF